MPLESKPAPVPDQSVKAKRFRCEGCAADQRFDAATGKLKCDFCGATREVPAGEGAVIEHDLADHFSAGLDAQPRGLGAGATTRTARCQECGANVAFPDGTTATRCTFCGSAKVLEQAENLNALRPESLIPFAIDQKRANEHFARWLGRLWFRPSDLKRLARVKEVQGVYVPFWTYDAHVESDWRAEAGYYYYTDEEYTAEENGETVTRTRRVQHTRWESAWGHRADEFDDVLVCGSRGLPEELAARVATFDTTQLVPYSPGFLAGFGAEEYGVDLKEGFAVAEARMDEAQEERCSNDVPGDTQRALVVDSVFSQVTFKHTLLPLWIAAYRYRDDAYRFLVNGQTGEVVGKAPYSWVKISALVLGLVAIAAMLYWYIAQRH